jgi:TRAP-type transport system small permease protein
MDANAHTVNRAGVANEPYAPPRDAAEEISAPYLGEVARPKLSVSLKIEEVILAAGMAGIAMITAANVVTRYLTNISLAFTEEYSMALMVVVTLVGTSYAVACGNHIRIGYFIDNLSAPGRRRAELFALFATGLCFVIILVYGAEMSWDDYRFEALSPGLGYPQWLFTAWLPLLSVLILMRVAERMWRLWTGRAK